MNPRENVESIYSAYKDSHKIVLSSLSGAINRLQKAFPKRGHFLMEFIQNADDCDSEYLRIVINEKGVYIYNSGRQFSERDVESICQVGQSSKTPEEYIGYLGVGFKSVFLISESPHIFSGEFKFKFDKNAHKNPKMVPWQIMPIWQNSIPSNSEVHWWKTSFYLPFSFSDKKNLDKLRSEIESESINSRLLLFLNKLRQIEIEDTCKGTHRLIRKSQIIESSEDYEIYELSEEKEPGYLDKSKWLIFRKHEDVPEEVKKDNMTIEWEREEVKKRETMAAFRLNDNGYLDEEKGAAHIGVFSFLPLKEEIEGLKFLIQGDFLTAPGREALSRKALWNEWLCDKICNLITNQCISVFLKNQQWKYNFTKILYSKNIQEHFFDLHLKRRINEHLSENPVLISEDEAVIKEEEAIKLCSEVRYFFDKDISDKIFPGRKILHSKCETALEVKKGPEDIIGIIEDPDFCKALEIKANLKDISWFKRYYKEILALTNSDSNIINRIRNEEFILTDDFKLISISGALLPTKDIPPELEHNFKLVNKDFVSDVEIFNFLKAIGIQEVTDKVIRDLMDEKQIPKIASEWNLYSDKEKIDRLLFVFDKWKEGRVEINSLSFLTLRTKDGKWQSPSKIKLGSEFNQLLDLEKVFFRIKEKIHGCSDEVKKTINNKLQNDLLFDFLSPDIHEPSDELWMKFLDELGVNKLLVPEKNVLVNRLSIINALIYEDQKGRKPKELTETEKRGYDIESVDGEVLYKIEVKGSENVSPNLWISAHEYEVLVSTSEEKELYWVFIIGDVLSNPRLYRLKGVDIKTADTGINLESSKWRKMAKAEAI